MREAKKSIVWKALAGNPRIVKAGPGVLRFLCGYMRKFRVQDSGGDLILHSHLPPINSRAYARFIDEHLIGRSEGPSHAQIGLTDACPQRCTYCYNRGRTGSAMDTPTILRVVRDLKDMGVFWLGFTGGEPLLNKDIVRITEEAAPDCAVKLFTTGHGLTEDLAAALKSAGLFSVSVSLDHRDEAEHDRGRGFPGAWRTALRAVEIFRNLGNIHLGVSTVLPKTLLDPDKVEEFLGFLEGLGIDEAWLSETKPSIPALWNGSGIISPEERAGLIRLQDRRNRTAGMTVNYLAHFESPEHFGCNAGNKMIYVDAFGEVSPCVFAPMSFGNVRETPVRTIFDGMKTRFPPSDACFMNAHYKLFRKFAGSPLPLSREQSLELLEEARFGPPPRFHRIRSGRKEAR